MQHQPGARDVSGMEAYQRLLTLLDERRFDEAQVRGRVLLEADETGPLVRAKAHNLLCWTFIEGLKRTSPEAALHGEEAVRLSAALGERALQAQALCNLASAYYQVGNYEQAAAAYRELQQLLAARPDLLPGGLILTHQGLAQLALVAGHQDEALTHLQVAERLCASEANQSLLAEVRRRQTLVLLRLGRTDEAAQVLAQVDEAQLAQGPRSLWWKTHLRFTQVRVELARGHWASARPLAVNTMALARELGDLPVLAECTCLLALIDQAEGRREASKRARAALTYAIHSGRREVTEDIRDRLKDLLTTEL